MVMCNSKNEKIMKKIIFSIMAVSALFACQKENLVKTPEAQETVTFTAYVDGADTKAVLNETTKYSEWVSGDKITVHNGTAGFEFGTTGTGATAEFTYTGSGFSGNRFMAVYPAGDYTVDLNAKTVNASIPIWQQAQKGSYNSAAALAVAYSENNAFAFKNATALLKFTVNTDNVTHVIFHGNNGEALTGNVKVTLGNSGVASVECLDTELDINDEKQMAKVTWAELYAWQGEDHLYFEKGQTYYLAVAPQTFENGANITFRIKEGNEIQVKTTSKKIVLNANTIYDMGELEYVESEDEWGIIGDLTKWESDIVMSKEDNMYVAKSVVFDTAGGFKIRANKTWENNDSKNIGLSVATNVQAGYYYRVIASGESQNFMVAAGTYDIWFDWTDMRVYIMAPGAKPSTASEGVVHVETRDIYLNTATNWSTDSPKFFAHFWGGTPMETPVFMTEVSTDLYKCAVPTDATNIIFVRRNPSETSDNLWDGEWNRVETTLSAGKNLFTITDWKTGEWSSYSGN